MHFSLGQVWLRNKTPFLPVHCLKLRNLRLVDWGLVRKGPGEPDSIFLSLCATLVLQLLSTFLQTSSPSTSIYLRQPKLSHPMSSSLFYFLWEPLKLFPEPVPLCSSADLVPLHPSEPRTGDHLISCSPPPQLPISELEAFMVFSSSKSGECLPPSLG